MLEGIRMIVLLVSLFLCAWKIYFQEQKLINQT